jgi:uncharacterized protein with FMN-binding domain
MAQDGSNKKVANSLVAVSCGAVLAVYTAGYVRTRSAVEQFEAQAAERRAADPIPQRIEAPGTRFRPKAPEPPSEWASSAPRVDAVRTPRGTVSVEPAPVIETPTAEVADGAPEASSIETPLPPSPVVAAAAPAVVEAPPQPAQPAPAPAWKDGTYLGWGTSRHGNIQAEVVIDRGRIASATIAQCRTRYSCSVIDRLPPEVAQRQSPDVDYVSGATQSANAFYFAVVDALSKAK